MNISNQAVIDPKAQLGKNVKIGPFSIIGPNVTIDDDTEIASNVVIEDGTHIGKNCRVYQGAILGGEPQIVNFKPVPGTIRIGDNTVIREYVTIHRPGKEGGLTEIGSHCMLMGYSHVAHDCRVGNHVVVVNYTGLSGHIVVEDYAFISGMVGLHQYVRVGAYAMVGGMSGVSQDVLPYSMVSGIPARLMSVNTLGLRRRNFKPNVRAAIKQAFKIIRSKEFNTEQAIQRIESEIEMCDEIRYLINFMKTSERGFVD